jgi:hypothetical protein
MRLRYDTQFSPNHLLDTSPGPLVPIQGRRDVRYLLDFVEASVIFDLPLLSQWTPWLILDSREHQ